MKIERSYVVKRTQRRFTVEVEIDLEALAQKVAARAIHNKSGKASLNSGDVKCKVLREEAA